MLLISHDRKADAENPQDRAAGSKQVMATPRLALHLDGSSIEQTKGNIGGKAGRLAYSIQAVPVPGVRDPQPVMTFGAETVFDDPFGPGRGDGSTDREVLEYVMSTTEAVTVNQINSALGARSQSRKRVVKAAVERCYRAGQLTRVEVERAGRKRDGFVVPEEHGSARFDHGSHHATYAPEHRSNSAPPSVGGALPNDAPVGPSPTTSSGAPSEPCSEPCSESILISGNTPPVNPPEAPIREDAQMPIVTPPPVPDAAPDKMTVEQIGDLAGPSPASGLSDAELSRLAGLPAAVAAKSSALGRYGEARRALGLGTVWNAQIEDRESLDIGTFLSRFTDAARRAS